MANERTPLLQSHSYEIIRDPHDQFWALLGVRPSNLPPGVKAPPSSSASLYKRVTRERTSQNVTYLVTACLSNSLLLMQVILGGTLAALGASESSYVLITVFGVLNSVVAEFLA